jgi:hypothetical protein
VDLHTDVATANVRDRLPHSEARAALHAVLDREPDLVGLQEWRLSRLGLLAETGKVGWPGRPVGRASDYVWVVPQWWSECPVGFRADRYELLERHARRIAWFGRADAGSRSPAVVPARSVTVVRLRDLLLDVQVSLVDHHLSPGVQRSGRYRDDRPLLVARHRLEVERLERVIAEELSRGHVVYAVGDSNFDGQQLAGLRSAWEGRESHPGTLWRRKIDDVHGPVVASHVELVRTPSDHAAVIARFDAEGS